MFAIVSRLLLAGVLIATTILPAYAQFGLPVPGMRRLPLPLPGPGRALNRGLPLPLPGLAYGKFRRALGVVAVVAVGAVILGNLGERDRREVAKRAKVAIDRNPEDRVVESYTTQDGRKQVTITAHPTQKISDLKDDPALKQTTATSQQGGAQKDQDSDAVKVGDLAPDTPCRKVTTELERKGAKKADAGDDGKSANTSILCQTAPGEWKPAST
jgi:hypothetical protein